MMISILKKRLAFQYGRQAAKKKLRFAPALDPKMQQESMCDIRYRDTLIRAWFQGYAVQMRRKCPEIADGIIVILNELYASPPIVEWSNRAREAKNQLEQYGV